MDLLRKFHIPNMRWFKFAEALYFIYVYSCFDWKSVLEAFLVDFGMWNCWVEWIDWRKSFVLLVTACVDIRSSQLGKDCLLWLFWTFPILRTMIHGHFGIAVTTLCPLALFETAAHAGTLQTMMQSACGSNQANGAHLAWPNHFISIPTILCTVHHVQSRSKTGCSVSFVIVGDLLKPCRYTSYLIKG